MVQYAVVLRLATVAWSNLRWKARWFSEIEDFPSTLLSYRWPHIPNLGDMALLAPRIRDGLIEAPDILVGGTPCQAFSMSGKRKGLSDPRGQLTLSFVELANQIDTVRASLNKSPSIIVWENVTGVLSSHDNAFGHFLGALAGAGCALQPARKRWANAGVVSGPSRIVAWRVLMPNISESPRLAEECLLWQVLEKGSIPERYYLSSRLCRRAIKTITERRKNPNPFLIKALKENCTNMPLKHCQNEQAQ